MELPTDDGSGEVASSLDAPADDIAAAASFSLPASGLKPKLDSIFSEVEKNLPEIDFDLSDVSFCVSVLLAYNPFSLGRL